MEICVQCGEQRISCPCDKTKDQQRAPHIVYPVLCARCGVLWPKFFMVSNAKWLAVVGPYKQDIILCEPCYRWQKRLLGVTARTRRRWLRI